MAVKHRLKVKVTLTPAKRKFLQKITVWRRQIASISIKVTKKKRIKREEKQENNTLHTLILCVFV